MKPQCNNVALVCNFSLGQMFGGNPVLRYLSILNLKHMFVFFVLFVLVDKYAAKYAVGKSPCANPLSSSGPGCRLQSGGNGMATHFNGFSMFVFTSSMLNCAGVEKSNSHENVLLVWRTDAERQCWEFEPTIRLGVAKKHGWIRLYINPNKDTSVQPSIFAKMGWLAKCSQSAALRPGAWWGRQKSVWKVSRGGNAHNLCQRENVFFWWCFLCLETPGAWLNRFHPAPTISTATDRGVLFQKRIVSLPVPAFFELDSKTCLGTPTRSCFCFWGSMFLSLFRFSWKHSHGWAHYAQILAFACLNRALTLLDMSTRWLTWIIQGRE